MTISKQIYANNATTTLSSPVSPSDTVIQITDGSTFPSPIAGQFFLVTLEGGGVIEIVKVTGRTGNILTGCIRGQEDFIANSFPSGTRIDNRVTGGTLTAFARLSDRCDEVSSVDLLSVPSDSNSNSYICHSTDYSGNPIIAFKNTDNSWNFSTHKTVQVSGSTTSGTTTSLISDSIGGVVTTVTAGTYIVQFLTGVNSGLARLVTSSATNTVNWSTPLPNAPTTGDQFRIYKSDAASFDELRNSVGNTYSVATGTGDAALSSITSTGFLLIDGMEVRVRWPGVNTLTTPSLSINSGSPITLTSLGGNTVPIGALQLNQELTLRYDISTNRFEAINLPAATTAPLFTNNFSIATTAFVKANSGRFAGILPVTGNTTLTAATAAGMIAVCSGTLNYQVNLPVASTVPAGVSIALFISNTSSVNLLTQGSDTLNLLNGSSPAVIPGGESLIVASDGLTSWYAIGGSYPSILYAKANLAPLTGAVLTNATANITPVSTDNSLSLATTAFVKKLSGTKSGVVTVNTTSALTSAMIGNLVTTYNAAGPITISVPSAVSLGTSASYTIVNPTNYAITLTTSGNIFVGPLGNGTFSITIPPATANGISSGVELTSDGSSWYTSSSLGLASTAPTGDNTNRLANTAFVRQSIQQAGLLFASDISISTNRTVTTADIGSLLWFSGAYTLTVPTPTSLGVSPGATFTAYATSATGTIVAGTSAIFEQRTSANFYVFAGDYVTFVATSGNQWSQFGTAGLYQTALFTGTNWATPVTDDNSARLATTAYVKNQGYQLNLGYTPYNSTNPSGFINSAQAPVQSVAGRTGSVALGVSDISGAAPISNPTFIGNVVTTGGMGTSDFVVVSTPGGGNYNSSTISQTGAFKITLPVFYSDTMLQFTIRVYEYNAAASFDLVVSGYNYETTPGWTNCSAYLIGDVNSKTPNVRFGDDGTKTCIWIGDLGSVWSYPQLSISDVLLGYNGQSSAWLNGWGISPVTAFNTVTVGPIVPFKAAGINSPTFTGTVSGITQAMVGLSNVDNTSDVNKPVSTAQATLIATKPLGDWISAVGLESNNTTLPYMQRGSDSTIIELQPRIGALNTGNFTSATVTNALGFTPYNSTNPSGFISGISSANVTTALGFTPYNSTNPSGFISGISSANVTNALGFTPYNSTNPAGYITASGVWTTSNLTALSQLSNNVGYITASGVWTTSNLTNLNQLTNGPGYITQAISVTRGSIGNFEIVNVNTGSAGNAPTNYTLPNGYAGTWETRGQTEDNNGWRGCLYQRIA